MMGIFPAEDRRGRFDLPNDFSARYHKSKEGWAVNDNPTPKPVD